MGAPMHRYLGGPDVPAIPDPAAAIFGGIRVQDFAPDAALRQAEIVIMAHHGRHVRDGDHHIAVAVAPLEAENGLLDITALDPGKAFRCAIELMESSALAVEVVQIADEALE